VAESSRRPRAGSVRVRGGPDNGLCAHRAGQHEQEVERRPDHAEQLARVHLDPISEECSELPIDLSRTEEHVRHTHMCQSHRKTSA